MQIHPERRPRKKRRVKLFLLLLTVVTILALAFVITQNRQANDKTAPQKPSSGSSEEKVRAYDASKYMFGMPENWKQLEKDELALLNASGGIKNNDGKALATMTIVSKTLDPDDLLSDLEKRQRQLQGYQEVSDGEVKVGEHQGVVFVYTYTNNGVSTQQTIYAVSTEGEAYYLSFTAAKDDYDRYKDEWAKILAAYRIK